MSRDVSVTLRANVAQYISAMQQAATATSGVATAGSGVNMQQLGGTMQNVGRTMTRSVTLPMVAMGGAAVAMSNKFDTTFTRMTTLAGIGAGEIDGLRESVLNLSRSTGRGPQEIADALYDASSSGLDARQSMDAVTVAARGAASGLGNTGDIISLISSATASYGAANMSSAKATDILLGTIRAGRADPDELAGSLGRILPVASSLGVQFDEVGGITARLSTVFGDTGRTVTSMSGILQKLSAPTQAGRDALRDYGSSFEEIRQIIEDDGLIGAFEHLREIGLGDDPLAFRALFDDVEARQGAQAIIDNLNEVRASVDEVRGSAGSLNEAFAAAEALPGFKMSQAVAEVKVALIEFGDAIGPLVADVAGAVAQIVSAFAGLPGGVQMAIAGALVALGPLTTMAGTIVKNAQLIRAALGLGGATAAGTAGTAAGGGGLLGRAGSMLSNSKANWVGPAATMGTRLGSAARWGALGLGAEMLWGAATNEDGWRAGIEESTLGGWWSAENASRWNPGNYEFSMNPFDREFYIPTYVDPRRERLKAEAQEVAGAPGGMSASRGGQQADGFGWSLADPEGAQARSERQSSGWWGGMMPAAQTSLREGINVPTRENVQMLELTREEFAAIQGSVVEYKMATSSYDWGQAPIQAASTAMGSFNSYLLGGHAQTASMEGAMDGLAGALQNVGTIGVGGLNDLNLKTAEGRAAFQSLQEVAGSWEPVMSAAVAAAGGNVDNLRGRLGGIREDFIAMAMDAGIGAEEAGALADAIGLIPENAQTLIELAGAEEAKSKLGLLQAAIETLPPEVQAQVNAMVVAGDYEGALAVIQEYYGANPAVIQATAETAVAEAQITGAAADRTTQLIVNALTAMAEAGINSLAAQERVAQIIAQAETTAASEGLDGVAKQERIAQLIAEALTGEADSALQALTDEERAALIDALAGNFSGIRGALAALSPHTISVNGRYTGTSGLPTSHTMSVRLQYGSTLGGGMRAVADGGLFGPAGVRRFAGGGHAGGLHDAMLMPHGDTLFVWREPETMGESFIPHAPGKRGRSIPIWEQTGRILGVYPFAAGGMAGGSSGGQSAGWSPSFDVRVFVGDREITDIVRTEMRRRDLKAAAGRRH